MREEWDRSDHSLRDDAPAWAQELFTERQLASLSYVKLWSKAVAAAELSPTEKVVALVLALYFSGDQEDSADPSLARLADETGLHRATVVRCLDRLDDLGLIDRERSRGRRRSRYWLSIPDRLELSHRATVAQRDGSPTVAQGDGSKVAAGAGDRPATVALSAPTVALDDATVALSVANGRTGRHEGVVEGVVEGLPEGAALADTSVGLDDDAASIDRFAQGQGFGQYVADGIMAEVDVTRAAETIEDLAERRSFLEGYRDGLQVGAA